MPAAAFRVAVGIAAVTLAAASPVVAFGTAGAHERGVSSSVVSPGTSGFCRSSAGVTVVVDMSALGGNVTVRCAPGPAGAGFNGIDALQGAGFTVTGTQRYGLSFVCRIQGRPTADERLAIPGNPNYREQCVDTPPQTAFWSYWYAPNGGSWTYSSAGGQSHDAIPGGFEGWAFSLGRTGKPAAPAIDPTRPQAKPPAPPPTTTPPRHHSKPGGGGSGTPGPPSTGIPPTSATPPTDPPNQPPDSSTRPPDSSVPPTQTTHPPRSSAPGHRRHHRAGAAPSTKSQPPTADRAGATTGDKVTVSGDLPRSAQQSAGSSRPTLIGLGVLVLLGLGAGLTAWRRSHRV
jgi:hypothetical protein